MAVPIDEPVSSETAVSYVNLPIKALSEKLAPASTEQRRTRCGAFQCLIVSAHAQRREMLRRAAEDAGWEPILCTDADTACEQSGRMFVQLAIVDLEPVAGREPARFREVSERLAPMAGLLLVICGNESRPDEEIWARQLGAWLYLPGVMQGDDVAMLCGEARQIAEQLAVANGKSNGAGGHANGNGNGNGKAKHVNGNGARRRSP